MTVEHNLRIGDEYIVEIKDQTGRVVVTKLRDRTFQVQILEGLDTYNTSEFGNGCLDVAYESPFHQCMILEHNSEGVISFSDFLNNKTTL